MATMKVDLGIWSKLSRAVLFLIVVAVLVGVAFWYSPLITQNESLRKRILALKQDIQRTETENRRMDALIKALQNDSNMVERFARQHLNYARPGETVIKFEEPPRSVSPIPNDPRLR